MKFDNCNFEDTTFTNSDLSGSIFNECSFLNTTFTNCNLTDIKFINCIFEHINIDNVFANCTFKNTIVDIKTMETLSQFNFEPIVITNLDGNFLLNNSIDS
jgi:uncharacterized protein YjbI with pentapeptide repeats